MRRGVLVRCDHLLAHTKKVQVVAMSKKSMLARLALATALVIATPVALVGCGGGSSAGGDDATAEQAAEPELEPYTVSEEQLDTSNQFAVYVTGTLTNNTEDEVGYIQVEYNLYDADGAQVGTALANTNNLKAGGSWKFEAIGTASPDEVASYELVDVTSF